MTTPMSQTEMMEALAARAQKILSDESARDRDSGRILAEIANLLDKGQAEEISAEEWEDHELAWQANVARLRAEVVAGSAKIMLAFESMARHAPGQITPVIAQQLHWWQNGGRESFLSELPIERRRALEEEARQWPKT
jgi:hypothetical protein